MNFNGESTGSREPVDDTRDEAGRDGADVHAEPVDNGPYARAAQDYLTAGWHVVPVIALSKQVAVSERTGRAGRDADPDAVASELERYGRLNIALRMPSGVVGIDVDAYDGKTGDRVIEILESELGPLPAGPSSSARPAPSGIRFFRVPEGVELAGQIEAVSAGQTYGNVEIIQRHHRYAIVWPSLHAGTRTVYTWSTGQIPKVRDLPELPASWVEHLRRETGSVKSDVDEDVIGSWWVSVCHGEPSEAMLAAVPSDVVPGSRHDALTAAHARICMMAAEGECGAERAESLTRAWWDRVMSDQSRPTFGEYERSWRGALRLGYARKIKMLNDSIEVPEGFGRVSLSAPDSGTGDPRGDRDGPYIEVESDSDPYRLPLSFWTARPVLTDIRNMAHSRAMAADPVLLSIMAKISSTIPGTLRVDSGIGSPASLNLIVGLIAESGVGKSTSADFALDLVPIPPDVEDYRGPLPIGSGEGMCEAYMGIEQVDTGELTKDGSPKTKPIKTQVRRNVLFIADEGRTLVVNMERQSSTLGQVLRTMWSGGPTGQTNAKEENSRHVSQYAMGMIVGFQPVTALPLLDGHDEGTPQRFLWCYADDPTIPDHCDAEITPLPDLVSAVTGPTSNVFTDPGVRLPDSIKKRLRTEHLAKQRGQLTGANPYDSHKPLMLIKLASLLAVLDGRGDVTEDDWGLARVMYRVSARIRDRLLEQRQQQVQQEAQSKRDARVAEAKQIHQQTAGRRDEVQTTAMLLLRFLSKHPEVCTPGKMRNAALGKNRREMFEEAAEWALAQGWLTFDGERFAIGSGNPA